MDEELPGRDAHDAARAEGIALVVAGYDGICPQACERPASPDRPV